MSERLWSKRPSALAAASSIALGLFVSGAIWLSRLPHPFAGEPLVTADIPAVLDLTTASVTPPDGQETPPGTADTEAVIEENSALGESEGGEATSPEPEPAYQREASIIMAAHRAMKPAPIASVTEVTDDGPLPRISDRGKRPFDVYSQVTPRAVSTSSRPKIAILLGGMGLNAKLTAKATRELPGDISFGFAPYGSNLQVQVNQARAKGHEIMLQLPMEPVGYPGTNPGPSTLLSDAPAAKNIESLHWLMKRFSGYSGVTNYMGARLLVTADALQPVMAELKKRGLVYLEDATVSLTLSPRIGDAARLPVRRASLVIDADPSPSAIAEALGQLEQEAIANGIAIGTGSGLEVTIDTVAEWAKDLQEKGILLVPVSASYKGQAS
jgi:uncharacterized protein